MAKTTAKKRSSAKARSADAAPSWALGLGGVIAVFVVYAFTHALLRLTASLNLPQDDVMAVLYSHTLQLAYTQRQPPLYDWMLWAVQQVTGPTLVSFLLLKYALLTGTGAFIYLAGRRMFGDRGWAALAAFSIVLFYQIGWNIHEGVTHTASMMCAIAATFWAFMRVVEEGTWRDYGLLGLCLGLGGLTKYGFVAFVVILLLAAMLQPAMREKILSWRTAASFGLAGLIVLPFALWVILNNHDLALLYNQTLSEGETGRWRNGLYGAFLTIRRTFIFLSPLIVLVPLIFSGALAAMRDSLVEAVRPTKDLDWEKLVLQIALIAFALMLLGSLLTGASNFRMRYMHPFYLLMPLWFIAMARKGTRRDWQPKAFVAASLAVALIVLGVRVGYLYVGEKPFCSKCRQMTPYAALADSLSDAGFKAGTIIAGYRHTAGNLRRLFPDARVVMLREPLLVPPIRPGDEKRQVAIVWDVATEGVDMPKGAAQQVTALGGEIGDRSPQTIRVAWSHLWRPLGYRKSQWRLIVIDLAPN